MNKCCHYQNQEYFSLGLVLKEILNIFNLMECCLQFNMKEFVMSLNLGRFSKILWNFIDWFRIFLLVKITQLRTVHFLMGIKFKLFHSTNMYFLPFCFHLTLNLRLKNPYLLGLFFIYYFAFMFDYFIQSCCFLHYCLIILRSNLKNFQFLVEKRKFPKTCDPNHDYLLIPIDADLEKHIWQYLIFYQ